MALKTEVVADGYELQDIIKTALLNYLHRQGTTEAVRVVDWSEDIHVSSYFDGIPDWDATTTIQYEVENGPLKSRSFDGRFYGIIEDIRYQRVQITMVTEV